MCVCAFVTLFPDGLKHHTSQWALGKHAGDEKIFFSFFFKIYKISVVIKIIYNIQRKQETTM